MKNPSVLTVNHGKGRYFFRNHIQYVCLKYDWPCQPTMKKSGGEINDGCTDIIVQL